MADTLNDCPYPETVYLASPHIKQNIHGHEQTVGMFLTDKPNGGEAYEYRRVTSSEVPVIDVDVLENDIAQAEAHLKSLCNSGGRTWSLSIPVRSYDTDVVYANVIRHAKTLLAHAKGEPKREIGSEPYIWLDDPRTKIMLAGWAAIQTSLNNEASQGHIRGWNIQPVPEAVKAQQLWEGLIKKPEIEGQSS